MQHLLAFAALLPALLVAPTRVSERTELVHLQLGRENVVASVKARQLNIALHDVDPAATLQLKVKSLPTKSARGINVVNSDGTTQWKRFKHDLLIRKLSDGRYVVDASKIYFTAKKAQSDPVFNKRVVRIQVGREKLDWTTARRISDAGGGHLYDAPDAKVEIFVNGKREYDASRVMPISYVWVDDVKRRMRPISAREIGGDLVVNARDLDLSPYQASQIGYEERIWKPAPVRGFSSSFKAAIVRGPRGASYTELLALADPYVKLVPAYPRELWKPGAIILGCVLSNADGRGRHTFGSLRSDQLSAREKAQRQCLSNAFANLNHPSRYVPADAPEEFSDWVTRAVGGERYDGTGSRPDISPYVSRSLPGVKMSTLDGKTVYDALVAPRTCERARDFATAQQMTIARNPRIAQKYELRRKQHTYTTALQKELGRHLTFPDGYSMIVESAPRAATLRDADGRHGRAPSRSALGVVDNSLVEATAFLYGKGVSLDVAAPGADPRHDVFFLGAPDHRFRSQINKLHAQAVEAASEGSSTTLGAFSELAIAGDFDVQLIALLSVDVSAPLMKEAVRSVYEFGTLLPFGQATRLSLVYAPRTVLYAARREPHVWTGYAAFYYALATEELQFGARLASRLMSREAADRTMRVGDANSVAADKAQIETQMEELRAQLEKLEPASPEPEEEVVGGSGMEIG